MRLARRVIAMLGGRSRGLLALMLAVLVLTPSFDFECAVEGLSTVSPVSVAAQDVAHVERSQPAPGGDHDKSACPHGHCHHASIAALRSTPMLSGSVALAERPLWATTPILVSAASTRLDRPPRA